MAVLPRFKRILREDIPGAPAWVDVIIGSVNQFFETVYNALNKALSIENENAQILKFRIQAGATATDNTFRFALTMTRKPALLTVGKVVQVEVNYTPVTTAIWIDWRQESEEIIIDSISGLTNTKIYDITVKVE